MARPRKPEVPHVPPTAEERRLGTFVRCGDCERDWSGLYVDRRLGRCLNCARVERREQKAEVAKRRKATLNSGPPVDANAESAMVAAQKGACPICKRRLGPKSEGSRARRRYADHDPVSGHLRGYVCADCKLLLNEAADDPERLRAAAEFVQARSKKETR